MMLMFNKTHRPRVIQSQPQIQGPYLVEVELGRKYCLRSRGIILSGKDILAPHVRVTSVLWIALHPLPYGLVVSISETLIIKKLIVKKIKEKKFCGLDFISAGLNSDLFILSTLAL